MKKIILLFSVLCLLVTHNVVAQEPVTGIKGGVNLTTLTIDGNNDENLKFGFHVGVFNKIPLNSKFAIQPELLYSSKGMKQSFETNGIGGGDTKFNLNYIDLPVYLVYNLSRDFEFQFGPYLSYLANANFKTEAEVLDAFAFESEDEIDRDNFHSLDFGLSAGLAFDLQMVVVGFNYSFGLTPVAKDNRYSYAFLDDAKNSVIKLYAGLKF